MRPLLAIALLAATSVYAQEIKDQSKDQSASAGATAPQPSFRRDASASRALFDRLDKNRDGYLTGSELTTPEALTSSWLGSTATGTAASAATSSPRCRKPNL